MVSLIVELIVLSWLMVNLIAKLFFIVMAHG